MPAETPTTDIADEWHGLRAEEPRMSDPKPSYFNKEGKLSPNRAAISDYLSVYRDKTNV